MKDPRREDIPKSVLRGYNSYGADLSYLNGKGKMLFLDPRCVVIGLENLPYTVFLTPEFDLENCLMRSEKIYMRQNNSFCNLLFQA